MTPNAHSVFARPQVSQTAADGAVRREDATWTRPIFRPPPLEIQLARDHFAYSGTTQRTEPWATWPRQSAPAT
jgi:hypothetical protein